MIPVQPHTAAALDSGVWKLVPKLEWSPTGTGDTWEELDTTSFSITQDRTQQTRWTLTASVAPTPGLVAGPSGIHSYGCRMRASVGVQSLRSNTEFLAYGRYSVTSASTNGKGIISLQGSSEEVEVQAAQFPVPRNLPGSFSRSYRQTSEVLIREVLPTAAFRWSPLLTHQGDLMPALTADKDRWATLYGKTNSSSICNALGAEIFPDRSGVWNFIPIPTLQNTNPQLSLAWDTYQVDRNNTYDRTNVYNLIVVTGQSTDGQSSVGPQFAWDTNKSSLTYAGPNPILHPEQAGPYSVKPYFYNSPLINSETMAANVARSLLANATGYNNYLTIASGFDPRMEVGDAIWADSEDGFRTLCLIDKITFDLASGSASVTTRSTNGISAGIVG